uniref:Uncharacterized protein n=1 Tax=Rhizophora mucronata TaxID=61149 RepID=A0A2P2PQF6_RHIMU
MIRKQSNKLQVYNFQSPEINKLRSIPQTPTGKFFFSFFTFFFYLNSIKEDRRNKQSLSNLCLPTLTVKMA